MGKIAVFPCPTFSFLYPYPLPPPEVRYAQHIAAVGDLEI
jgi:hypothetical protein